MWQKLKNKILQISEALDNDSFMEIVHFCENLISRVLAISLILVIFISLADLIKYLFTDLFLHPVGSFGTTLIEIFGLFLNILIAMELLENITGYLRKNVVQVELVIVTAIIAVSRKIIIFDFDKYGGVELVALVAATIGLSGSYWILRKNHNCLK